MTIHQVIGFCALAKHKSFTKAASSIYISQSAFSRLIASLEDELGVKLYSRDYSAPGLTREGREVLPYFQEIEDSYRSMNEQLERIRQIDKNKLVIGVFNFGLVDEISGTFDEFQRLNPQIKVEVQEHNSESMFRALEEEKIDFTMTVFVPEKLSNCLSSFRIGESRWGAIIPKNHPKAGLKTLTAADLAGEPLIALSSSEYPLIYNELVESFKKKGIEPNIIRTTKTMQGMYAHVTVENAIGITIISPCATAASDMVFIEDMPPEEIKIFWNKKNRRPVLYKYLDFVRRHLGEIYSI